VKSLTAVIKGGLGNQLFIYAANRAFALESNRTLLLDHQTAYIQESYSRKFQLNNLPNIQLNFGRPPWNKMGDTRYKWVKSVCKRLPDRLKFYHKETLSPSSAPPIFHSPLKNITTNGFWQDEQHFKKYEDIIRKELSPPAPQGAQALQLSQKIDREDSVMLHVRRERYPHLLGRDYYLDAISKLSAQLSHPTFYVFGDNIEWARSLKLEQYSEVNYCSNDDVTDLWLMSRCRHAIIANSSFSWWGAWLGTNHALSTTRIVYSPLDFGYPIKPAKSWLTISSKPSPSDL
jgi:hypothetical protein